MQDEKYYGMISEISDIDLKGFPSKFPMFFLCTAKEKDSYNKLMVGASARGFNPKIRKLCFTLGCSEGFKHEDIFNLTKELPEIDKEKYMMLKTIVHWNPIQEASLILKRFIELSKTVDGKLKDEEIQDMINNIIQDIDEQVNIKPHPN
jgi:hypothetical protein